ncbi:hypothetical protein EVJ58_g7390 [Rhodofomes roseus]|uniref:AB hydrolase-1 domain-containing protein n=1 Tax=Rhodofomes roseus TaxID=34475 RepID=A0A4Y9Y5G9_9APHY|nr:hypothetical protein EVJ58_g7390 [Rhodofomes roseus]
MASYSNRLPDGVSSRMVPVADLDMHILEAGDPARPLILLLHGFPELAFSWREVILPIAQLGYRVVVPDQRGFGRTRNRSQSGTDTSVRYEDDPRPYRILNIVRDAIALVYALGYRTVAAVLGHDAGSPIAAYCTLIRPDIFQSVVMMSAPFGGPPPLHFDVDRAPSSSLPSIFSAETGAAFATLDPPRKHYGLYAYLRAYFHMKSADWPHNDPHELASYDPSELAKLPHYYMMPLAATMPEAVAPHAPSSEAAAQNRWLPDSDLAVYVVEYGRTGFQGGLNWYRAMQPELSDELAIFAGRKIERPAMFLSGRKDWGVFQAPGALQRMKSDACARMEDEDVVLVEGAGHWVQQEQPEEVVRQIERFLKKVVF